MKQKMKNNKLFVITILFCIVCNVNYSQNFNILIKGGLNLSNMIVKDDDKTLSDDYKMLPGFHIHPAIEYSFSDLFSLEGGIAFQSRGYKVKGDNHKFRLTSIYLDIPINAKFNFNLGNVNLFCSLGPYVAFGIGGKIYKEGTVHNITKITKRPIKWGSDWDDDLKTVDYGLNFGVGLDINNFMVGMSYGWGLANLCAIDDLDYKIKNYVLQISVGYKFNL